MNAEDQINLPTGEESTSRRQIMRRVSKAAGGFFLGSLAAPFAKLLTGDYFWPRWYDVVQDMKDSHKWHVNLFAAPHLGDVENARHLSHRVIEASDIGLIKEKLEYPVRVQFRDGHREQIF